MLIGLLLQAQKNYTVKVTDSKTRNPITNASVNIKSTSKGAVTNTSGSAVVQALPGDVLEITSIGYASQNVTLSAQTSVSVVLESLAQNLC